MKRTTWFGSLVTALTVALGGVGYADAVGPFANISTNTLQPEPAAAPCVAVPAEASCNGCCRESYWYAGAEMTFLHANVENGGQITASFNDNTTVGTDYSIIAGRGYEGTGYAPRIWFGRKLNEDWGVVARFWNLSESREFAPTNLVTPLPNFATFTNSGTVNMHAVDLEAVRSVEAGKWKIDGSLGARQASFLSLGEFSEFGVFTTGNFINLSHSVQTGFDGAGVTYALMTRRQVSDWPAWVYLGGRGSNLWGLADGRARTAGTVASSPSAPLVGAATVSRNNYDAGASIVELQTGVQIDCPLAYLPASAFFRAGFEYQFWAIHTRPVGGAGFGGTIGDLTTNSFAGLSGRGTASLVGFTFGTGLMW